MTFTSDLKIGNQYEQKYVDMIDYDSYEISKGCFKPYDIKVVNGDTTITYEIKADRMTAKSGNVVIEYACNGKPSGITSSEADYWIYFIVGTDEYIKIPTSDLRQLIADKKYTRSLKGGDGWRSQMYLFPKTEFQNYILPTSA
jgi:hypothetical protein